MARRVIDSAESLDRNKRNGGNLSKDDFVDLKPDPSTGTITKTVRVIGSYLEYIEHSNYKKDPSDPEGKETIKVPYPDYSEQNKSYSRICKDDDKENCDWCKLGYRSSTKYAWVCLERQADGTSVVKIINKGLMLFSEFFKLESENRKTNLEEPEAHLCEHLGGEKAPNLRITATNDKKAQGGIAYSIGPNPISKPLTQDEIDLLKAKGCLTAEELEEFYKEVPAFRKLPIWYTYGPPLDRIYKYKSLKTAPAEEQTTPASDLEVSIDDEEDTTETPVAPSTAKTRVSSRKPADAPAASASDDGDSAEEGEEEGTDIGW